MADSALVLQDHFNVSDKLGSREQGGGQPLPQKAFRERIKVVGVGGGGNNALDHIIRSGAAGVEFLAVNTDANCLDKCLSVEKLVLGERLTRGLGAGARPEVGEQAALESREAIRSSLRGCDMVYLAAGMGGGTGTGALPIIAGIAKEMEILTVSVVTRPFSFEGKKRARFADEGIEKVKEIVDALIVVPNDRLLAMTERTTSLTDAFSMADNVLRQAVQGVTDLVTKPGFINVDFADLRNIMQHAGGAVMGIGTGTGERRAHDALKRAMESPLMENSIHGAKGVILNVTANPNVGIIEVQDASASLQELIDPDANFIWGLVYDENMGEEIQMVVIATGFDFDTTTGASVVSAVTTPLIKTPVVPAGGSVAKERPQEETSLPAASESLFSMDSPLDTPAYLRRKR